MTDDGRGEERHMKREKKFSRVKPTTQTNPRMKERGREPDKGKRKRNR
jgi:hypothetical protein